RCPEHKGRKGDKGRKGLRREGRLGHGPGWLWPWPRRPGDVGSGGEPPGGARPGRGPGGARETLTALPRERHETRKASQRPWEVHASVRVQQRTSALQPLWAL